MTEGVCNGIDDKWRVVMLQHKKTIRLFKCNVYDLDDVFLLFAQLLHEQRPYS